MKQTLKFSIQNLLPETENGTASGPVSPMSFAKEIITVTNLDKAIEQAAFFKDCRHANDEFKKMDKHLRRYRSYVYFKFVKLKDGTVI